MDNIVIKGETKDFSRRQLEFISSVLEERGFKNESVTIESAGKAGDNFVANVKRIIVSKNENLFKMIAKIAPDNENHRITMNTATVFQNEHFMYTKVLPKFAELEKEANIPTRERLRFAACYGSLIEEPNEIILIEDLCVSNFMMLDKFKTLTSSNVKLVLKDLSRFHSLSYVLKNQDPETFDLFSRQLKNYWVLMGDVDDFNIFLSQIENDVILMLDDEKKPIVKGLLSQMVLRISENAKFYSGKKSSVIQQGDVWTNNIMFRKEGESETECCMIDYQMSNENSPIADIQYMIFHCTDYETRSKHYHEWIDYYYTELDNYLSYFGLKANDFYTRDELDADSERQSKQCIGQLIMEASMLMREHHEAADYKAALENNDLEELLNVTKLDVMETTSKARFLDKIEGLIKSFQELGYL